MLKNLVTPLLVQGILLSSWACIEGLESLGRPSDVDSGSFRTRTRGPDALTTGIEVYKFRE